MTGPEPRTAVVRRVLPAPPDVVFDEWTDPDALADWMCPRPARPTRIELEPRAGGSLRIDIEDRGTRLRVTGRYLELSRPRLLRFTWSCSTWPDPDLETYVTVLLEPHGSGETLMTIEHSMLPPQLADDHAGGWAAIAGQLLACLQAPAAPRRRRATAR